MDNFSQAMSLLDSANQANALAEEQMDRIQSQKEEKAEAEQQAKDAFAQAGELLGGGLIEKSAENLIKKGIKLGRDKLTKLGVDANEIEKMNDDYNENGPTGLIAGVVKRNGIKTRQQLNSFINNIRGKMEGAVPSQPSDTIVTDEFGLPNVKADAPIEAPLVQEQLVKTGSSVRNLDPDFQLGKYRLKTEEGQLSIVNRETGNLATEKEVSGENELLNKLAKTKYTEPTDPLESLSTDPVGLNELKSRFESYGLNLTSPEQQPISDLQITKPIPRVKPSIPKPTEDLSRYGVGDVENLPTEFKSTSYASDLTNARDYGKQISKALFGEKQDNIKLNQLRVRLADLKTRKSNLDSDSLRSMYKEKISNAPRKKIINGREDVNSFTKNVEYKENAMDNVEKFQGLARTKPSSAELGIVKSQEELFPAPPQREEDPPTQEAARDPKPVNTNDDFGIRSIDEIETPNLGSTTGILSNTTRPPTDIQEPSIKIPAVSNEIPTGTRVGADTAESAIAEAGEIAGETDLALAGPADPISDIVSAVVGIGALVGGLVGDKPKPPPRPPAPPQIRSSFQIGADV